MGADAGPDAGVDAGPDVGFDAGVSCGPGPARPASPTKLAAAGVSSFEVSLTWEPSTEVSVKRYRVLLGAAQVGLVNGPSFTHRPVVPGETYTYTVTALTDAGGESPATNPVTVTIPNPQPDALSGLAAGHWYEFPSSKLQAAALSPDQYPWLRWGEGIGGIMNDWSSGALDTQRDRLYISGGGHNGYFGNEIYSFDLRTGAWRNLTEPDRVLRPEDECPPAELGVNCAIHTYDGLEYVPPPFDRFVAIGWDGRPTTALNLDTNRWQSYPDMPQLATRTGSNSAYDPHTRVLWYHSGAEALSVWDPVTGKWTVRGVADQLGYYKNAVVDPRRKLYVEVGQGVTDTWSIDALGKFVPTRVRLETTGDTEIEDGGNPGVDYDPVTDRIVAWKGGGDIYTLDLDTRVWTKHAARSTVVPGPANLNGTYGRFRYVPGLNVFVVVNTVDTNVFVYRLDSRPARLLRRIDVKTAKTPVETSSTGKLQVTAVFQDGSSAAATSEVTLSSLDPDVATVDAAGTFRALSPGRARLQASYTDPLTRRGLVGALELEVVPMAGDVVLDALKLEPSSALKVVRGRPAGFTAVGSFHRGTEVFTRDVTCEATWSSDSPAIATVTHGTVQGVSEGATTLRAKVGAVEAQAALEVIPSATRELITLNFQPPGPPMVTGWAVADDSAFDAARGWGWQDAAGLYTRGDRLATRDPRLASFVATTGGRFRLQVPDGRYHVAASVGDNTFGSGLASVEFAGAGVVYGVGGGNTAGASIVEATSGKGLVFDVVGPINWLAVMRVNGLEFDAALAAAKTW
ncbi:Ig-like domain-containing protein [Pyxidicoccus xibeiensis]|uniref:Ig-like domain-containing protein n=1 Tax=Pyxidicoccus xibeiensis TaxID=2906759 RepID=UPI0020A78DE5|nr:Ig-like domain-containing protein [Pyxidicoccus xibeiensis]MCP3143801.1 Ig-like domain-containing protein [Pyxidicoccus xibeiensis]